MSEQDLIFSSLSLTEQPTAPTELTVNTTWTYGIFGSGIGASGLVAADIDNDGVVEMIAGGSNSVFGANNFWYVLEPTANGQGYSMTWSSDPYAYPTSISKIAAFDTDDDGIASIFVGLGTGEVSIYNGSTLQLIDTLTPSTGSINQILFADADNDSIKDIVIGYDSHLYLYDASSLTLKHQINYGSGDFAIGNVDSDADHEIVLSNGLVLQVNGTETTVEWDYAGGDFGASIALSDIDGDGMEEIIGASSWYYITAFDADLRSPKWQINTGQDIAALLMADVDGDGREELLYGDGQWGAIHAYDVTTQTQKWEIDNPEHGVTNIAVADTDGDGVLEVVWGSGASSTGPDHLYVYDSETQSPEWESAHQDGPFRAMDIGDVDGDGRKELIFASFGSNSGYSDGIISVIDGKTHTIEWQSQSNTFGGFAWTGIHDVQMGDVNDDGHQDIVVATDRLYDGAIYVIDGVTKTIQKSYFYDDGAPMNALAIADVDNDGNTEIIAGGSMVHTGAPGVYTYILDGTTGAVKWKSINLGNAWSAVSEIEVGNLDGDEAQEIVALNDRIFVFDGVTHQQWQSSFNGVSSIHLHDIDQDGKQDILAGMNTGHVVVLDGETYETKLNIQLGSSGITALQTYDFENDGQTELVYANGSSVGIYSFQQSATVWQSGPLGSAVGNHNSLLVSDTDKDGNAEIIVGTSSKVVELEVQVPHVNSVAPEVVAAIANTTTNTVSPFTLNVSSSFSDADGNDGLIYSAAGLPDGLTLDLDTGVISGMAATAGQYLVTITATDPTNLSVSDTFQLTVFNRIQLTASNDTHHGTINPDQMEGLGGRDRLYGAAGDDWINGGTGHDQLWGQAGHDSLMGGQGHDSLNGGIGRDRLKGGSGQDHLNGGTGADRLIGGADADTFILKSASGVDTIIDFTDGVDVLGLSHGLQYNQLTITQEGDHTLIADANGLLAKLSGVSANLITSADFVIV